MRRSTSVKADVAAVPYPSPWSATLPCALLVSPLFAELGAVWGPSSRTLQSRARPRGRRDFAQSSGLGGAGRRCKPSLSSSTR